MHSFQNFIVRLIPNYPPPSRNEDMEISCETMRALNINQIQSFGGKRRPQLLHFDYFMLE